MTHAQDMLASALATITELGTTCTVRVIVGSYAAGGTVTETTTSYTGVLCSDLVDESKRYAATDTSLRCDGTFYVPASGLGFVPAVGNRVVYQTRTFQAVRVDPFRMQGSDVAYRMDVAEVGT